MRTTSARRRASKRAKYRGTPGLPIEHRRHDYTGDGPSFVCPRCGAIVASVRPRHAPGGGKALPWSACEEELPVARGVQALPVVTEAEARALRLVSRVQVARHFGKPSGHLRQLRTFPEAVARLDMGNKPGVVLLFEADNAIEAVRWQRPKWREAAS